MASITTMSRTERYARRLDERLESTHPDERLPFLRKQQVEWIAKHERFCERVDRGEQPEWGEDATDYSLTLAEISSRISKLEKAS